MGDEWVGDWEGGKWQCEGMIQISEITAIFHTDNFKLHQCVITCFEVILIYYETFQVALVVPGNDHY